MIQHPSLPAEGLQLQPGEPPAARGGKKGCFFRGCLILGVVLLLLLLSLGGCIYLKYRELRSLTEESPVVFEELEDRGGQRAGEVRERLEAFRRQALNSGAQLVLTVEELNLLLLDHQDPVIAQYAGFQRFRTVDDALIADVSLPIDWLSARLDAAREEIRKQGKEPPQEFNLAESIFGLLQGRYFNAAVKLGADPVKKKPGIFIRSIRTSAGREISLDRPAAGEPGSGAGDLGRALERVSKQALGLLLGEAAASVTSLEVRPGSILLRGGP